MGWPQLPLLPLPSLQTRRRCCRRFAQVCWQVYLDSTLQNSTEGHCMGAKCSTASAVKPQGTCLPATQRQQGGGARLVVPGTQRSSSIQV